MIVFQFYIHYLYVYIYIDNQVKRFKARAMRLSHSLDPYLAGLMEGSNSHPYSQY